MTVRRGGKFVSRIPLDLCRRHDVAAEIGELVWMFRDVAAHRHLRHAKKLCRLPKVHDPAFCQRTDESGNAVDVTGAHGPGTSLELEVDLLTQPVDLVNA